MKNLIHATAVLVVIGSLLGGCNSGSRDGKAYFGPGSGGASTGAAATPAAGAPPQAVAIHSDHLEGGLVKSVMVLVDDAVLASPKLLVDEGSGLRDVGAVPHQSAAGLWFTTALVGPRHRYQVIGRRGNDRVTSNIIETTSVALGGITVNAPAGDYTGVPPLIPSPDRANWAGSSPTGSYLVFTADHPGRNIQWAAVSNSTTYLWGNQTATTYHEGPDPLPSGAYKLLICSVDSTGWCTDSSTRGGGGGTTSTAYTFEVQ